MKILLTCVLTLIVAALALLSCTEAASIKLAWNANPPEQHVTAYEVMALETWGTHEVWINTLETTATFENLKPGTAYQFKARARNAVGVSEYCAPVSCVTAAAPAAQVRLTIQRSEDLAAWVDTDTVLLLPKREKDFFRIKVEEVKP
jgi:hypothetical protein